MATAEPAKILSLPARQVNRPLDELANSAARERRARLVVLVLILGVLALYWGGVALFREESTAGIQNLPAPARHDLYVQTQNEVDSVCRDGAASTGVLRDHCIELAHFLLRLPECGEACRRSAQAVLPRARR